MEALKFIVDLLSCASQAHNILTNAMMNIIVHKSTNQAKPLSIC